MDSQVRASTGPEHDPLSGVTDENLVLLRARVDSELARRGIAFDVGTLGESLAVAHFNSTRGLPNLLNATVGAKNVDALSRDGERYSIKSFMRARKTGTVYPDDINADKQLFEYLVVVRLDGNYQLSAIYRYSWEQFVIMRAWDKRMHAWYLPLSNRNLESGELLYRR